jgi:hypothetical protein
VARIDRGDDGGGAVNLEGRARSAGGFIEALTEGLKTSHKHQNRTTWKFDQLG